MEMRRSSWIVLAALAGCWQPRPSSVAEVVIRNLQSAEEAEREEAFQELVQSGAAVVAPAKAAIHAGANWGFPLVAVLYVQGEGDAVPLELRARHLAAFRWPRDRETDNAVLQPYVWNEIERDLVRTGRPALRLLARALEKESPSEAKALQAVRVMLRIGGRAAAEEFAGLLGQDRDLGGTRVCDVAAAALLLAGYREPELRMADREGLVRAAREWWARAKEKTETEWLRDAAADLADRWRPGDPGDVRPVLELLAGGRIEDPASWCRAARGWSPPPLPVRPEELLPRLDGRRPEAFDANRRLEIATGVRFHAPRAGSLEELRTGLRSWEPGPELAVKWRRYLESARLRLSVVVIAHVPSRGANHVAAGLERYFHATEDEMLTSAASGPEGQYILHLQSREMGTRLAYSEYVAASGASRGIAADFPTRLPVVVFSPLLKACTVVTVEEVSRPGAPRPPDALFAAVRACLRGAARGSEGAERLGYLRALGYCQDKADLEFLRAEKAPEALLLLGDAGALAAGPRLESHEVEMALRRAEDPRVREYLESLRDAGRETPGR